MSLTFRAYGKLNLTLNVEGMYSDKFHRLSSVLTTVSVYDTVTVSKRDDKQVNVCINGVQDFTNPAFKIGSAIVKNYGTCGVDVKVIKRIPSRAGMGGSSVTASATVNAMCMLYSIPLDSSIFALASLYGSDIAYLITGGLALATGKGDDVTFFNYDNILHFTVIEGAPLTTADVFAQYDLKPDHTHYDNEKLLRHLATNDVVKARNYLGNNLTSAAIRLAPSLSNILAVCDKLGLPQPTLTGSGGNFFILCGNQNEAEEFAHILQREGFTTYALRSVNSSIELEN